MADDGTTRSSSIRDNCPLKDEFDTCMENWDNITDETLQAWSVLDYESFRGQLLKTIQNVLHGSDASSFDTIPQQILDLINDTTVHPITILDTINKADRVIVPRTHAGHDQLLNLIGLKWIRADYITKILLSFIRVPDSPRKIANMKSFFGIVFAAGEKWVEDTLFIRLLLEKVDVVLRILAAKGYIQTLDQLYPRSMANFIERIFIRHYPIAQQLDLDVNPFASFMDGLLNLCEQNFKIQRIISNILLRITPPAQEKILVLWFRQAMSTKTPASMLFYPLSTFLTNPSYEKTLLERIPFSGVVNTRSVKFWKNWADYVSSDHQLIPTVWDTFTNYFWKFGSGIIYPERLIIPALAFAALCHRVKENVELSEEQIMCGTKAMETMTHLMNSTQLQSVYMAGAISYIVFDLCRIRQHQTTGEPNTVNHDVEGTFKTSEIYQEIVSLYEDRLPEKIEATKPFESSPESSFSSAEVEDEKPDDGQEKYDECLDDRVKRLRAAGLTPTSMLDVYLILSGDTTGSNDSETEALKQLVVLTIPILLSSGLSADPVQAEYISRILLEWDEDDEMADFVATSLAELGNAYPEIVATSLEKAIFSKNHSIGDKGKMLKVTTKALICIGTNRCISCSLGYEPQKREEYNKFINRMEPAYYPMYLHRNRPKLLCYNCPPIPFPVRETGLKRLNISASRTEKIETHLTPSQEVGQISRRPAPITKRWSKKSSNIEQPVAVPSMKNLHCYMWSMLRSRLTSEAPSFLNANSVSDQVQTHFLIQVLEFARILLITYTSLSCHMEGVSKDVLKLLKLYGEHPNRQVRQLLWYSLEACVTNPRLAMATPASLLNEDNEPDDCHDLLVAAISSQNDCEIPQDGRLKKSITTVYNLYVEQRSIKKGILN